MNRNCPRCGAQTTTHKSISVINETKRYTCRCGYTFVHIKRKENSKR